MVVESLEVLAQNLTKEVAENFINIFASTMDEDSEKNLLSHFNARECE